MEVPRIAGKDDDRAGWISGEGVTIERITQTNVENARDNRVNTVFRMPMRHQLCTKRRFHTNDVWPRLRRIAHDNCQLYAGRERSKRLPVDVFRKNRYESVLAGLMLSAYYHDTSLATSGNRRDV